jgi:hypothetical protein
LDQFQEQLLEMEVLVETLEEIQEMLEELKLVDFH